MARLPLRAIFPSGSLTASLTAIATSPVMAPVVPARSAVATGSVATSAIAFPPMALAARWAARPLRGLKNGRGKTLFLGLAFRHGNATTQADATPLVDFDTLDPHFVADATHILGSLYPEVC